MRSGAPDEELIMVKVIDYKHLNKIDSYTLCPQVVRAALGLKKEKHAGMEDIDVINNRPMIKIGG